jgi:putative inorganic carbon (HCO3(-)) transporter
MAVRSLAGGPPLGQTEDRSGAGVMAGLVLGLTAIPLAVLAVYRPATALVLLVAVAVFVACIVRVELALLLLVAAAPLEDAFRISGSDQLTITKLAGALCFTSFAIYALTSRRKLLFDTSHALVLLILALAILSTLQAEEISPALTTTLRYASFIALYIVVSQFVGDQAFQRRLAWVLSVAATLAGVIALNDFLSGAKRIATLPYGDPNDLAYMLATTLPLTFWLLRERWTLRLLVLPMIGLISAAVLLSFSRGALVGLGAAVLWQIAAERRSIPVLAAGAAVVLVVTLALVRTNPAQVEEGLQYKQRVAAYNVETRLDAWRAAIDLAEMHPLLGIGPGNFQFAYPEVADRPPGTQSVGVVHNAYLDVAAELGVLGMVVFVIYLVVVFGRATLARRRGNGLPGYAAAVRTALVVAIVAGLFLSEQYYAPFWLLGGLATALWREDRPSGSRS